MPESLRYIKVPFVKLRIELSIRFVLVGDLREGNLRRSFLHFVKWMIRCADLLELLVSLTHFVFLFEGCIFLFFLKDE